MSLRRLLAASVFAAFAGLASPALAQDEVIVTGGSVVPAESFDALAFREAIAYANPLPRGAPDGDYPLVAWCEALVAGHVALGETLTDRDDLDDDLIRLGRAEAAGFRGALIASEGRQTPAVRAAAAAAAAEAAGRWRPLMDQEPLVRDQAFGLFMGLPGRCEHAARRLRDNITTPPATLESVGLSDESEAPAGS